MKKEVNILNWEISGQLVKIQDIVVRYARSYNCGYDMRDSDYCRRMLVKIRTIQDLVSVVYSMIPLTLNIVWDESGHKINAIEYHDYTDSCFGLSSKV